MTLAELHARVAYLDRLLDEALTQAKWADVKDEVRLIYEGVFGSGREDG